MDPCPSVILMQAHIVSYHTSIEHRWAVVRMGIRFLIEFALEYIAGRLG